MSPPPPRPASERPEHIGFTRRPMVRWLEPSGFVTSALPAAVAAVFGAFADKRETQAVLGPATVADYSEEHGHDELWVDYVSDVGDGFNPTYAVASLLAAEHLMVAGTDGTPVSTPRGRVLVMGGDQVYPVASVQAYEDRFIGPYRAALPHTDGDSPHLYAVPGNHDWYDGLTSFLRVFAQHHWVGGWKTQQDRSYFALKLPHRWWLWGIDIQLDTYIDAPQLRFFTDEVGPQLEAGDNVILCSAKPNWVKANEGEAPDAFAHLDYFERHCIRDRGARLRLSLTGDAHHYAHYEEVGGRSHRITAGGGGAYLSATHHLPADLELPPSRSKDLKKTTPPFQYELKKTYPDQAASKRMRRGIASLPFKNPSFGVVVASVHLLYRRMLLAAVAAEVRPSLRHYLRAFGASPGSVVTTAVLARGLVGFTKAKAPAKKWGLGLFHSAAHLLLIAALTRLTGRRGVHARLSRLTLAAAGLGAGSLLGSWVTALYLAVADRAGCNDNELFAAQRIEDHKCFLRLHVDAQGGLTVYAVGVDQVPGTWSFQPSGSPGDPWFTPVDGTLQPRLIEEPIRLEP